MKNVYLYVHSHWDREWYREFEEFHLRLIEVVDDVIEKLEKDEFPCFYFDGQTAALEDYLQIRPEKEDIIRKLIAQKRLYIGPFYCSADSFLVSAEFMLRNLLLGTEYSKKFGCNDFIGYLSDTFGHSASMPEILKSCGIERAMLWRGLGELPAEFLWKDLKVTYLIQGYFQDIFSLNIDYPKKAELLTGFIDKISARSGNDILLPCGADHLKTPDKLKEQVKEINKLLNGYKLIISNPFEYLEKVKNNYDKQFDTEFLNQSKNFLLKGVYSSRIYQKYLNAICEWELSRIAEPITVVGAALKTSPIRQSEIDYTYKTLIKNHAHDSIYGCSIDSVHKDVQTRFEHVLQLTDSIKKRVIRDFSNNFDKTARDLYFLNLSNYEFSGAVEIETDKKLSPKYNAQLLSKHKAFPHGKLYEPSEIPVTEDMTTIYKYLIETENLKPFSITKGNTSNQKRCKITAKTLENEFIGIKIKGGKIDIEDKINNKIYRDFIEIIDRADAGDSYNFGPLKKDKPIYAVLKSSKIKTHGRIKNTLRLTYEIEIPKTLDNSTRSKVKIKHRIFADISLTNSDDYLTFKLEWENKAKNHILQVKFNHSNPVNKTLSEDMLGLTERNFDTGYNIYDFVPAPRGIELKTNTAPFQRFVWAQNAGIMTKGLNEYEVYKNSLYLTILRATELISEPKNPARGTPAGPPLSCPDLQCLGKNTVEFAIKFTCNPQELYQTVEKFYGPVVPFFAVKNLETEQLFDTNNENIIIQALKFNKTRSKLIVRLVNISNIEQTLNFKTKIEYKKIHLTNSIEEKSRALTSNLVIAPKDIITLELSK